MKYGRSKVGLILWCCWGTLTSAQTVEDELLQVSTPIQVDSQFGSSQASGFYYNQMAPLDPSKSGPQWVAIQKTWLVTNRHVVLPRTRVNYNGKITTMELLATALTFNMRRLTEGRLRWEPLRMDQSAVVKRAKCHPNPEIDVCIIEVGDLIHQLLTTGGDASRYVPFGAIAKDRFPGGSNKLSVQAGDPIIVVGYPKGFYDDVNLFPVLKAGAIASRWGSNFKGGPCFLIDGQMFPGSSGSLVISRPTNITTDADGKVLTSKHKQFAVLGVLSGEWWNNSGDKEIEVSTSLSILTKGAVNTGIVWYGSVIEDVIASGVPPAPVGLTSR